jgi:hypothetical protein
MITPEKPFVPIAKAIEVQHAQDSTVPDLVMSRGSTVIVTVIDSISGKPVAGTDVEVGGSWSGFRKSAVTNSAGQISVPAISVDRIYVKIPTHHIWEFIELEHRPTVNVTYQVGNAVLHGQIVSKNKQVREITLKRTGYNMQAISTDSDGNFTITGLTPGSWELNVSDLAKIRLPYKQQVEIPPGESQRIIHLE